MEESPSLAPSLGGWKPHVENEETKVGLKMEGLLAAVLATDHEGAAGSKEAGKVGPKRFWGPHRQRHSPVHGRPIQAL